MNIFELLSEKYVLPSKPRLFQAFSGIGCQLMAFNRLGIEVESIGVSEIDKYAIQSYNAIHGYTKNFGSICDIKGTDLPQIDVFTWSFPCTDLSKAGKQKGLTNTRSGLVYEVLRIMQECKINGNLPKVLIMENVVDLVQVKFIREFQEIQLELEQLGYSNYTQVLNAKDYGVAQNRERVFMVSILGDYYYEFPQPIKLEKRLKDYLESEVDPKYYLSDKFIKGMLMEDTGGVDRKSQFMRSFEKEIDERVASAITTRETCVATSNFILMPEDTKQGYAKAYDGDGVYTNRPHQKRGVVQSGMIQTLKTSCSDVGVVVHNIQQKVSVRKFDVDAVELQELLSTSKNKVGITNKQLSDKLSLPITLVEHWFRKDDSFSIPPKAVWFKLKEVLNIETSYFDESVTEFIEKDGVYEKSNRVYHEDGLSPTITCVSENEKVTNGLRIRKLTERECGRLMGVDDNDITKMQSVVSRSQMYKQFGNGIVVDVFASILKTMKKEN